MWGEARAAAAAAAERVTLLARAGPEAQCRTVLLFWVVVTGVLLPPLLLLPFPGEGHAPGSFGSRLLNRTDAWLERWLRLLVWPHTRPQQQRQQQRPGADPSAAVLVLRWWIVLSACWRASGALAAAG